VTRVALCFPGQGSLAVGMGKEFADAIPAVRALFDEASETVGIDLARVSFEGPVEELTRTEVQQPALVTTSLACLVALEQLDLAPVFAFGHSVGEFSALGACGALSVHDAVALIARRAKATAAAAAARPGVMAAILGLDDRVVEDLCAEVSDVWPANYNCPGQIVVSGTLEAVGELEARARERGARRIVRLRVTGAFHCPLVASAGAELESAAALLEWREPKIPFVSTVSAAVESRDRLPALFVRQLTAPVRFKQTVSLLVREGVDLFVEVGPGQVLSGLIRRIDRSVTAVSVGDPASLEELEEVLSRD
jgi:[acyl-carrier-protein] S-malonyltransferase